MDRYAQMNEERHLRNSHDRYQDTFQRAPDDYNTCVNAAAKIILLGGGDELELAAEIAARVQWIVGSDPVPGDYWITATVAEVASTSKHYETAASVYSDGVALAPGSSAPTTRPGRRPAG